MAPSRYARDRRTASVRYTLNGRFSFSHCGYLVNAIRRGEKARARGATDIEIRVSGEDWTPLERWTDGA